MPSDASGRTFVRARVPGPAQHRGSGFRGVPAQRRSAPRSGSRLARADAGSRPGRPRSVATASLIQGKAVAAPKGRSPSRPWFPFPRAVSIGGQRDVRRRVPRRLDHHRRRPGGRPALRDRGQRRHGQGRHLLPDDGQEALAGPGSGAGQPPTLHLPGRLRRGLPTGPGRGLPRPNPFRAHLLQPGQHVCRGHPPDRGGPRFLHGGRGLPSGHERRGRHRGQPGDHLPGRASAGKSGDR